MRIINYLFGEKLAGRVVKAIFFVAWFSMLPNFFNATWHGRAWLDYSMPLLLLSFFAVGVFSLFANRESLIDFWRPTSKLARQLANPQTGNATRFSFRAVGFCFVVFTTYIAYEMFHASF